MRVAPETSVREARAAADDAGVSLVVIVRGDDVLDGVADLASLEDGDDASPLAEVADGDPPATRPNATGSELVERVRQDDLAWIAVTDTGGRFLGVIDGARLLDLARHDQLP